MQKNEQSPTDLIADDLARFYDNPLGYVYWAFPWGEKGTVLENFSGPRKWQEDYLAEWGAEIRLRNFDGITPVKPIQIAVASGHGIGKSALSSWIIKFIHDTRPDSRGCVTANTSDQLKTKTWAELGKWHKISLTKDYSNYNSSKGNMNLVNIKNTVSWRVDALTCREENSESFAGLHAVTSTPFYLFDEASAIPQGIFEVAQGGLTDGEPMFFLFGNPTKNTGYFRECFGKQYHRWIRKQIDSRDVIGTNHSLMEEWIADYGLDSDYVKVRVRGIFPSSSVNQLIPYDLIKKAQLKKLNISQYNFAPVIITCDPAWEGDDRSVIYLRQGLMTKKLGTYLQIDNMTLGGLINQFWEKYNADACFIDVGWGAGVIDYLRGIGRNPQPVNFGGKSLSLEYNEKRTEMWCEMLKWLQDGGVLEDDSELADDLVSPEYSFMSNGKKLLESKKHMKARGLKSPDIGDALALTFASPVYKKTRMQELQGNKNTAKHDWDVI